MKSVTPALADRFLTTVPPDLVTALLISSTPIVNKKLEILKKIYMCGLGGREIIETNWY